MKYVSIITNTNGTTTTIYSDAPDIKTARKDSLPYTTEGATLRVYPLTTDLIEVIIDGKKAKKNGILTAELTAGALMVVRRTTANMIAREGGSLQYQLYNECRRPLSEIDDPNVLDCISVARLALLEGIENGDPIDEQYHRAYLALNKYLRNSKQINLSATAQRTLYIEDINGDIINISSGINAIVNFKEYAPTAINFEIDRDKLTYYSEIIIAISGTLTPTQRKVLIFLAKGYSERKIAEVMHRGKTTIHEHITIIRKKAADLFPNGYKK